MCIRRDCYAGNVGWGCACPPCAPRPPPAKLKRLRKSARPAHPAHQCCQKLEGGEACALHLCTRLLLLVCTRAHLNNGRQDVKHWVRELLLPLNHLAGWWGQSMAGWAAGRAMHAASDQGGGRQLVGCRQQAAIGLKFQVKFVNQPTYGQATYGQAGYDGFIGTTRRLMAEERLMLLLPKQPPLHTTYAGCPPADAMPDSATTATFIGRRQVQ